MAQQARAWLRRCGGAAAALALATGARAQFTLQDSGSTADLRGIVNVGNGTAWASGTHGTVLRTEDAGFLWQGCATPPGAEQLDFRGIQAFDDQTAIVMSSGKGDLSRVYKTTDGCKSWKLVFTNPDAEGFFDSILIPDRAQSETIFVLGDSVANKLVLWTGYDEDPDDWQQAYEVGPHSALPGEGSFAASNSVLVQALCSPHCHPERSEGPVSRPRLKSEEEQWRHIWFASQVSGKSLLHRIAYEENDTCDPCRNMFSTIPTPMAQNASTAGIFSLAFRDEIHGVAVGGDYGKPAQTIAVAAATHDAGTDWLLAQTPPHGFRSSVAYNAKTKTWITVGPNGADISNDDGKNWRALKPGTGDDPDADKHWNALSLPYVVGPHGRIGRLRDDVLPAHK